MRYRDDFGFRPYVPVAERRRQAAQKVKQLEKGGRKTEGVQVEGRKLAHTFWGKAWGDNLEAYSDYANRLPRGRTYLRNGSVVDLQIARGRVSALVSGSHLYEIQVNIQPLPSARWKPLVDASAGEMLSMVDLLAGTFSEQVMRRFCDRAGGLFPAPKEITLKCSCPDWADMCKHVAATLYGVGARLDARPELLFTLRGVDPLDLVAAAAAAPAKVRAPKAGKVLDTNGLGSIFGIELGQIPASAAEATSPTSRTRKAPKRAAAVATKPKSRTPLAVHTSKGPVHSRVPRGTHDALTRVVALVKSSKVGLRAEQIREKLGLEPRELLRVLTEGLEKKVLKKRGQKRSTTYAPT
jgi:uncharacterized Zn finger protein